MCRCQREKRICVCVLFEMNDSADGLPANIYSLEIVNEVRFLLQCKIRFSSLAVKVSFVQIGTRCHVTAMAAVVAAAFHFTLMPASFQSAC